jgi:hypothetical protein
LPTERAFNRRARAKSTALLLVSVKKRGARAVDAGRPGPGLGRGRSRAMTAAAATARSPQLEASSDRRLWSAIRLPQKIRRRSAERPALISSMGDKAGNCGKFGRPLRHLAAKSRLEEIA